MLHKFDVLGMSAQLKNNIDTMFKLRHNGIHKFRPKVEIAFKKGSFLLKTTTDKKEVIAALKLRHQVFFEELVGSKVTGGVDVDHFDILCDHLVIIDESQDRIVGTYRINGASNPKDYYSSQEFDLARLLQGTAKTLELGRACIHKDYRRGPVIALLWRGIAQYMQASRADIIFGCASIRTQDPAEAALLYRYFEQEGRIRPEYLCQPVPAFKMPGLSGALIAHSRVLTDEEAVRAESLIPPLFRAYLKAGCFIGGFPAWDAEFRCIDFLTILCRETMNDSHTKKYFS